MRFLIPILFLSLGAWAAPQSSKKLDLTPVETPPTPTEVKPETGDVDMTQFKGLNPSRRGAKVDVNVTCQLSDGTVRKKGDRGYKECIENEENRLLRKTTTPEAVPYDPRTN